MSDILTDFHPWTTIMVFLILAHFPAGFGTETTSNTFSKFENYTSTKLRNDHDKLNRSQKFDHQSTVSSVINPFQKRSLMRNELGATNTVTRAKNSMQNTMKVIDKKKTRYKFHLISKSNIDTNKDSKNIDHVQDLEPSSGKRNHFLSNIHLKNSIDTINSNHKSKNPSNKDRKDRLIDTSEPHVTTNVNTNRFIEYGRLSRVPMTSMHELTKRNININSKQTKSTDVEDRENKVSKYYEPTDDVSVVPVNGINRNILKQKVNITSSRDGLPRHQKQTSAASVPATNNRNIRAREEGDVIIGALFPLHRAPPQKSAYARQCGEIWETYGIQRVETFLMTVDKLNRNPSILPNIKLGWDIRDSCWYSAIALENSIDFIKDAIASQSKASNTDSNVTSAKNNTNTSTTSSSSSNLLMSSTRLSKENDMTNTCPGNKNLKPIIGLVGPGSSESTIQVQNLLQIFNIPQIGYSATSHDLSDKNHYKYFLRVVPPDLYQAQVLVDILLTFNFTYISTVHSDGNYGLKGMTTFTDLAKSKGICMAVTDSVASTAEDAAFDSVLENLLVDPNASVVVCFCEGTTVRNIFNATKRRKMERRLLIIGSDGWGNRLDVVDGLELEAAGAISIMLHSPSYKDFKPHYYKLQPYGSPKNPWFNEFWEWRFKCSLDKNNLRDFPKICAGNESLAGTEEDSKLGFVVNAVTALALGLHNMHQDLCPRNESLCPAMEPLNGSLYLQYLLNVSFTSYSNEEIYFDDAGDPPGRYEILNYQPISNVNGSITYDYVTIGHWTSGNLTLELPRIYWPQGSQADSSELKGIVNSVCSEPCKWNQAKRVKGVSCCWICTPCVESEILVDNNTDCRTCDLGMWPNSNKTDCEEIPIDFLHWSHTQAVVCISISCLGICATLWVFAIFIRYHNTPVVKASTRELSYILLIGICLAFSSNFFIVSKPAMEVCYLTRILPGLSFSLMYGALVTRTNRIARILEGSKRIMTKKPKFMSATAQVVITGIIIGIECAVITAMLVYQPADDRLDYTIPKRVRLICDTSTLGIVVPMGFDLVLILLCTIYAVKTRNLPENFNEAKFIGFTMYSTCIIWLGFFPIYFAGENKEITLCISVSLSAAIALVLLFIPKVYVIVWVPEKNTRGAFTTSRDVRCHIGSKSMNSGDSIDVKESSTYESLFKSEKGHGRHWRQKSLDEKRLRFVMRRTGCSEEDTPYVNHGVLENHSSVTSTSFVDMAFKENSKTYSATVKHKCPEKETFLPKESREISNAEVIRQNLIKDFPMHKPHRPGSPAEKEKHRIHNVEDVVDLVELKGINRLNIHGMLWRHGEFRKSLSSTCVSTCLKTKSVQCQTTDDLINNILPPLRRRNVSKIKNKLERSEAVEDCVGSVSDHRKQGQNSINKNQNHAMALMIQRIPRPLLCEDSLRHSQHELSETVPLMLSQNYDHLDSLPMYETRTESSLLGTCLDDHMQRRHSHNIPRHQYHSHHTGVSIHCVNDSAYPSPILPFPTAHSLQVSSPPVFDFLDRSTHKVVPRLENVDNDINPFRNVQCDSDFKHLPKNLPDPITSPSSQNYDDSGCCYGNSILSPSLTRHDSRSSTSVSIASSSSFTLPPFHSSTDSNPSQHTFDDSDTSFDMEYHNDNNGSNIKSKDEEDEVTNISRQSRTSQPQEDYIIKSNGTHSNVTVVSLENLGNEEDGVVEFHRYLQGHGIQLELSTIQSSDL